MNREKLKPTVYWRFTGDWLDDCPFFLSRGGKSNSHGHQGQDEPRHPGGTIDQAGVKIATATQTSRACRPSRVQLESMPANGPLTYS